MTLSRKKTILLVEDEALIAMAEKMVLEKNGYEVITVHTGEKAVDTALEDSRIDLVLMDIDLGRGIDGTEAAQMILSEKDIPIVFLSSHTEAETVEKTEGITSYGYIVKNSGDTVLLTSIRMAFRLFDAHTELKQQKQHLNRTLTRQEHTEEELRNAESRLRSIINLSPLMISEFDTEGRYLMVNPAIARMFNSTTEELVGKSFDELLAPEVVNVFRERIEKVEKELCSLQVDDLIPTENGNSYFMTTLFPLFDSKGQLRSIGSIAQDITERKAAEDELEETLEMIDNLARLVPGVIYQYRLNPDGSSAFPYSSPGMNSIYEVSPEEVREDASPVFGRLHPDDYDYVSSAIQESARNLNEFFCEFRVILPRQGLRWRWSQAHPERTKDGGTLWHGIILDVTERKKNDERIERLAREKETLLKEVQHRIKNTMNTMVSVLSLQAETVQEIAAVEALTDAKSRFQSMEVLYNQLYRTDSHKSASVKEYLDQLARSVISLFPNGAGVELITDIEDISLDAGRLSPLGMIVNELVTNSMKYAFSGHAVPRLSIQVHRRDGSITVIVQDNGSGLPESFDIRTSRGFGLTMVTNLTEQLNGTIQIENSTGSKFVLSFPE